MKASQDVEIAIIGAGIAGIATAYYLCREHNRQSVLLLDCRDPMSYTSAQSGDNYRNWWPHPVMAGFTNHSIDLMEAIARESSNVFQMSRRGYAIATRRDSIDNLIDDLHTGYRELGDSIRMHTSASSVGYAEIDAEGWENAPDGVDVVSNQALIRQNFPSFSDDIKHVLHIRRAGEISGQQLGQYMLERIKPLGCRRLSGQLMGIAQNGRYQLDVQTAENTLQINADIVINAAGPFAAEVGAMLDVDLPIFNTFQQKIAFEEQQAAIPRNMPFAIDLDDCTLDWSDEERTLLAEDDSLHWLLNPIPGSIHCRPEGGPNGTWLKLGWAYNDAHSTPSQTQALTDDPQFDPQFPEIVIRGAAALNPGLKKYHDSLPSRRTHYGGYYSMTDENWPLIGPLNSSDAYLVGALSGFGSMSACAAGSLCAAWVCGGALPEYAKALSLSRYDDVDLMREIISASNKGLL